MAKILPAVLIVIQGAAAVVYATQSDWRQVLYWAAAAAINLAVTI